MAQNDKDGYARTVLGAHEMLHEALGFRRGDYTANHHNKSSIHEPSQLANRLGLVFGVLIIVFITWFLLQGF